MIAFMSLHHESRSRWPLLLVVVCQSRPDHIHANNERWHVTSEGLTATLALLTTRMSLEAINDLAYIGKECNDHYSFVRNMMNSARI